MYLSEFCDVKYEEKYNVVLVEWKRLFYKVMFIFYFQGGTLMCGMTSNQ